MFWPVPVISLSRHVCSPECELNFLQLFHLRKWFYCWWHAQRHVLSTCMWVNVCACQRNRERERVSFMCGELHPVAWFYRAATNFMCLNSSEFTTESEHKTLAFLCACQKHSQCTRLSKEIDNMNHNYMYPILFQTTSQCCHPLRSFFHSVFLLNNWFCLFKCCFLPSPMTSSKKICAEFQ